MQGIALGHCRKSDGMIFYCPHNKQVYTSLDYKLDEGRHTPNTFNMMVVSSLVYTVTHLLITQLSHFLKVHLYPSLLGLHMILIPLLKCEELLFLFLFPPPMPNYLSRMMMLLPMLLS